VVGKASLQNWRICQSALIGMNTFSRFEIGHKLFLPELPILPFAIIVLSVIFYNSQSKYVLCETAKTIWQHNQ
jgi:hypothetical protein